LFEAILNLVKAIPAHRRQDLASPQGANVQLASLTLLRPRARRRLRSLVAPCLVGFSLAFGLTLAQAQTVVPIDQLMAPGPLPDVVQGSAAAPVTIVEYASMTCSHCAAFHEATWPALKAKYVDSGKVKFILREYPLDPLATAGFMLARCAGPDKRNAIVDLLYTQQNDWAFVPKPLEALAGLVKQAGISQGDFESCLKNQELYDQVNKTHDRATEQFKINGTPTFFVNGREMNGELAIAEFDKILEPLLK
jgi:protein-disulfide isomerase